MKKTGKAKRNKGKKNKQTKIIIIIMKRSLKNIILLFKKNVPQATVLLPLADVSPLAMA
jgi:hypothetical protein